MSEIITRWHLVNLLPFSTILLCSEHPNFWLQNGCHVKFPFLRGPRHFPRFARLSPYVCDLRELLDLQGCWQSLCKVSGACASCYVVNSPMKPPTLNKNQDWESLVPCSLPSPHDRNHSDGNHSHGLVASYARYGCEIGSASHCNKTCTALALSRSEPPCQNKKGSSLASKNHCFKIGPQGTVWSLKIQRPNGTNIHCKSWRFRSKSISLLDTARYFVTQAKLWLQEQTMNNKVQKGRLIAPARSKKSSLAQSNYEAPTV